MKRSQKSKLQRRNLRVRNFPTVPNPGRLVYTGVIPTSTSESGTLTLLREVATLATGAGTSFNLIVDNNPSASDNWSEYSTSWSEYRILGMRFDYRPQFTVNTAAVATAPLVHSVLHMKSNPSIASFADAFSYGDTYLGHITKQRMSEWRMTTPEEATFVDCSAPAGTAVAYTNFSSGLTTATTYGYVFVTYLVQFRNARK